MPIKNGGFHLSNAYGICDVRGIYGKEIDNEDAKRLGWAIGYYLEENGFKKDVIVGGDIRISTPILKKSLIQGLLDSGCNIIDIGIVSTPIIYVTKDYLNIDCSIMVTASHNPKNYNGFKVNIGKLPNHPDEIKKVWNYVKNAKKGKGSGQIKYINPYEYYFNKIKGYFKNNGEIRIVIDSGNGCCAKYSGNIFSELGFETKEINNNPDGNFPNRSPDFSVVGSLNCLQEEVLLQNAAMGIAFDSDGDRVGFINDKGHLVNLDYSFLLFIYSILEHKKGLIVFDLKYSQLITQQIIALGGEPLITKAGYAFVVRSFLENKAILFGEFPGHYGIRDFGRDDGIFNGLIIAFYLQNRGIALSRMFEGLPTYYNTEVINIKMNDYLQIRKILNKLEKSETDAIYIDKKDGLKIFYKYGWALIRSSVSSPTLSMRFEGNTKDNLERIISSFKKKIPLLKECAKCQ